MKVWVIWDQLYERVMSVHATEVSASNEINKLNWDRGHDKFDFNYDGFEVQD